MKKQISKLKKGDLILHSGKIYDVVTTTKLDHQRSIVTVRGPGARPGENIRLYGHDKDTVEVASQGHDGSGEGDGDEHDILEGGTQEDDSGGDQGTPEKRVRGRRSSVVIRDEFVPRHIKAD